MHRKPAATISDIIKCLVVSDKQLKVQKHLIHNKKRSKSDIID